MLRKKILAAALALVFAIALVFLPSSTPTSALGTLTLPFPTTNYTITNRGDYHGGTAGGGYDLVPTSTSVITAAAAGTASRYWNANCGENPADEQPSCSDGNCNGEGFGRWIEIDHGGGIHTVYAHLASFSVASGEVVTRGQQIGVMGRAGCAIASSGGTGIHLHFGVRQGNNYVDPGNPRSCNPSTAMWATCPAGLAGPQADVEVMLIIDSSGSKSDNDPNDRRQAAARAYLTASDEGDRVGIVDFDDSARLASGLREARSGGQPNPSLIDAIETIDADGATNIRVGIELACEELINNGRATIRAAILLTDGDHNEGSFGSPQQCFADRGWPIFTFGLGDANSTLLDTIARETGGEFRSIPASEVLCEFSRVRSLIARVEPSPCAATHVYPGETTSFSAYVTGRLAQVTFLTSWCCNDVEMSLVSPSGRSINRNTVAADVSHDVGPGFEAYSIASPQAGEWAVSLFGLDLPPAGEEVVVNAVGVPPPSGDVNCDQLTGVLDAVLVLQFTSGMIDTLDCFQNADILPDGAIDPTDALLILQIAAGLIDARPPMVVLDLPPSSSGDDHGNSPSTSTPMGINTPISGNIETGGDDDFFSFFASDGVEYTIETSLGTLHDSYLDLYDANGTTRIRSDDDGGAGLASRIVWTAPSSATYYIRVRAYSSRQTGGYTLIVGR